MFSEFGIEMPRLPSDLFDTFDSLTVEIFNLKRFQKCFSMKKVFSFNAHCCLANDLSGVIGRRLALKGQI